MDYLLPSDENMRLMCDEYARLHATAKTAAAATYIQSDASTSPPMAESGRTDKSLWVLILYIVFALGYNFGYGTQIFNTHGGVGGFQPDKRTFRDLNNLV